VRRTSDATVRERLANADTLTELEAANAEARALIAELKERTRRPHDCHVCGTRTKEDDE
jgi:hypothetical protein